MRLYQYDETQLMGFANQVKDVVICGLHSEGLLTGEAEATAAKYAVIPAATRGTLGQIWDFVRGIKKTDDSVYFSFVKDVDLSEILDTQTDNLSDNLTEDDGINA